MSPVVSLSEWMSACEQGTIEVIQTALGLEGCRVVERVSRLPSGMHGSYIPLVGDVHSVQVGLVSTDVGCQALAGALLGMDPDKETISPADVADAVGELVNMIAGSVKRQVNEKIPSLALGLPIFIHGTIEPTGKLENSNSLLQLGKISAGLTFLSHKL